MTPLYPLPSVRAFLCVPFCACLSVRAFLCVPFCACPVHSQDSVTLRARSSSPGDRHRHATAAGEHRRRTRRGPRPRVPHPRRRRPRAQRGGRPRAVPAPAARPPLRPALVVPHHRRGERQHRRHPGGGPTDGRRAARHRGPGAAGARPRAGAARGLAGFGRPGAGVHGRRSLHGPGRAAAAGRAADQPALRPRDRHPALPLVPGRPRAQARGDQPRLQPAAAGHARNGAVGRAVRLQGHPRRRRAPAAAAGRGHRLVLRHRAARARRAVRAAHPRGAGRLDRRPRQPRRRRPDGEGGPGRHRPDVARVRDRPAADRRAARADRPAAAARPGAGRPAGDDGPAAALRGRRGAVHAGLPGDLRAAARHGRRPGGQPHRAPADRRREHRRQPAAHLRHPRRHRRRGPPRSGPDRLRPRSRADQRLPGPSERRRPGGIPGGGSPAARRRQRRRDAAALRPVPGLGLPGPPHCCSRQSHPCGRLDRRPGDGDHPMTTTVPAASEAPTGPSPAPAPPAPPARPSRARRLARGRDDDPHWVRPALLVLLTATGVLYLWDLAASGWANAFYSAAAQAGSQSWEAFFYGSSDAANSITVDKPPASLWVMDLSVRLFGLSSWSILVPQVLMGVATVGVLYLAVRRVAGYGSALLAGAAMAATPIAALMFRFNNPDALLVLLMTIAAYALTRAVEHARLRWLVAVGVLIGLAFLTKTLQAMLVVPGFALVYLIAAPTTLKKRIGHLLAAGVALVATGGWWVAIVELVPASARPYIGGSQTNSVWELIWGYNGLGRLTGDETGSVGGGFAGSRWGETGLTRLFDSEIGGQIAWLMPAAVLLLIAGLVAVGRAPRTDRRRAALLTWGTWLVVTALTFSLMAGIFHAYYTVALAPAIAGLVGIGGGLLWQRRSAAWARIVLAIVLGATALWSWMLLDRTADFLPWLKWLVLVAGVLAALGLLIVDRFGRAVVAAVLTMGILAGLGGPAAYAVQTAGTAHTGSIPSAGPAVTAGFGGGPGGLFPGGPAGGRGALPGGTPGTRPMRPGGTTGTAPGTTPGGTGGGLFGGLGGGGGLLDAGDVGADVAAALAEDSASYTWVAAAIGANNAAGYQLATELPVMPIGGFNGSDPSPTLAQFQAYVASGKVHWFIAGGVGGMRSQGGSNASSAIASWVAAHFPAQTIGGTTMYDLTQPSS